MTTRPSDTDPVARDPAFDAAWRAASQETPPPALDAAILAAAHRAADARPRAAGAPSATRPLRWWWPLAAAATIGAVAVGIVELAPPERIAGSHTEPVTATDMPPAAQRPPRGETRAAPAPRVQATPAAEPIREAAPPAASSEASDDRRSAPARLNEQPAGASARERQAAPAPRAEGGAAPAARRVPNPFPAGDAARAAASKTEARAAPPGPATPAALAGAPARDAGSAGAAATPGPRPVDEWIALIRRLRADGQVDAAARELAAFRRAHPDRPDLLPADLRDWHPPQP